MDKSTHEKTNNIKSAFVALAAGKKYQTFIVDYILFAQTAYPDVDVIILHTNKIQKKVLLGLEILAKKGHNFKLILVNEKKYLGFSKLSIKCSQIRRSLRWLIDLPVFHLYDELYIGDIDLLIMKEDSNLFEMHREHANYLRLPYSDIVRQSYEIYKPSKLKGVLYFIKYGLVGLINYLNCPEKQKIQAMTGLRYIKVKEYYSALSPILSKYYNLLANDFYQNKNLLSRYNLCTFSDEQILFDIMHDTFGFVPKESSNKNVLCIDPKSYDYRPHHGLHIGLFRKEKPKLTEFLTSELFYSYLTQFHQMMATDIFSKTSISRSIYYKNSIKRIMDFSKKLHS